MTASVLLALLVCPAVFAADEAPLELRGRVLEQGTGAGVASTLVLSDGTIVETDASGRFVLNVPAGMALEVHARGFAPLSLQTPIPPVPAPPARTPGAARSGPDAPWRIWLRRGAGEGEVVVEARRDEPVVAEQRLDSERVSRTPGTYDDAIRLIQSLPGVAQTPEYSPKAGDIAVRGSFPGDNRTYFDGIELPTLFHYNNYASVLPTRIVDELTLYPSTFASRFGDATGAIVDASSGWKVPDRVHGSANLSAIMAAGGIEAPLTKPDRPSWVLRANARRSYLDLFSSSSLQYTSFPVFSDWFGRLEHTDLKHRHWSIVGLGAGDAYVRYAGEPTQLDAFEQSTNPEFKYNRQFQVAALQHLGARPRDSLRGSLAFTHYRISGDLPDASSTHSTQTLALREDGQVTVADRLTVAVGGELIGTHDRIDVDTGRAWSEVADESELLARGLTAHEDILRLKGAVYVEPRWESGILRIQPGVRVVSDSLTDRVEADPRLGVRLHPAKDTYLRAATGLYTQLPSVVELSPVLGDPGFAPTRSAQVAAGADQAIAGRWELSLDGWAKWGDAVITAVPGEAPAGDQRSRALGASLSTRYRIRDIFFAWASLDVGQSLLAGASEWLPSSVDQPYAINLVASWTFVPTWNIGIRYRLSAGLPYTPISDGVYLATSDTYAPLYGPAMSARMPTYQKVDLHVEKRFELHTFTVTPYLEAWYVPPSSNVMYLAWSYDYDEVTDVHGPGFVPLVGVRGEL
ncbi:MAG: hypothetical protein EXR69_04730 [Myxococcales bacterium]|nr:hypothetical protein [Myxococcales bacterium]